MKTPVALLLLLSTLSGLAEAASNSEDDYRRALATASSSERGARLFETCARCHGTDGEGRGDEWVPRIGGERFEVVVRQLVDYRHGLRWDERMQANVSRHRLSDVQALADVAAFVSRLEPPPPPPRAPGPFRTLGENVYAQQCARCHGKLGEGKDEAPRLARQHYSYLRRQLQDIVDGRRRNVSVAHRGLLEARDSREVEGIADYLASRPGS